MTRQHSPNVWLITCYDLGHFLACYGVATACAPLLDGAVTSPTHQRAVAALKSLSGATDLLQ
jgi:hypothetical protein